jgi:hypothetical protein
LKPAHGLDEGPVGQELKVIHTLAMRRRDRASKRHTSEQQVGLESGLLATIQDYGFKGANSAYRTWSKPFGEPGRVLPPIPSSHPRSSGR